MKRRNNNFTKRRFLPSFLGKMSEEDKNSSSSYESSDDSSSSSSEEETIIKPVFISQRKSQQSTTKEISRVEEEQRKKEILNSKLDQKETSIEETQRDEFDGVDDTDDIEPELEYENWKTRELLRLKRDFEIIKQLELEKEDQLKRNQLQQQQQQQEEENK